MPRTNPVFPVKVALGGRRNAGALAVHKFVLAHLLRSWHPARAACPTPQLTRIVPPLITISQIHRSPTDIRVRVSPPQPRSPSPTGGRLAWALEGATIPEVRSGADFGGGPGGWAAWPQWARLEKCVVASPWLVANAEPEAYFALVRGKPSGSSDARFFLIGL